MNLTLSLCVVCNVNALSRKMKLTKIWFRIIKYILKKVLNFCIMMLLILKCNFAVWMISFEWYCLNDIVWMILFEWYCLIAIVWMILFEWYCLNDIVCMLSFEWYRLNDIVWMILFEWYCWMISFECYRLNDIVWTLSFEFDTRLTDSFAPIFYFNYEQFLLVYIVKQKQTKKFAD